MISSLSGVVTSIEAGKGIVLSVGGVGLYVNIPVPFLAELTENQTIGLHTQLIVRQDSLTLYGFQEIEQREFFNLLIGVSGIGPRLAHTIISALPTEAIRSAVVNQQFERFSSVPGIGKKTAQKILLHLEDRVKMAGQFSGVTDYAAYDSDLLEALTGLGYSVVEAQSAIQAIPKDAPEDLDARLRLALQYFASV